MPSGIGNGDSLQPCGSFCYNTAEENNCVLMVFSSPVLCK